MATCRRTHREQRNMEYYQIILLKYLHTFTFPYRKPRQIRRTQGTTLRQCTTNIRSHHGWHVPQKQINRSHHLVTKQTKKQTKRPQRNHKETTNNNKETHKIQINQNHPKQKSWSHQPATNHQPKPTNHSLTEGIKSNRT